MGVDLVNLTSKPTRGSGLGFVKLLYFLIHLGRHTKNSPNANDLRPKYEVNRESVAGDHNRKKARRLVVTEPNCVVQRTFTS